MRNPITSICVFVVVLCTMMMLAGCSKEVAYPPANLATIVVDSVGQEITFCWVAVYPFDDSYRGFIMKDGTVAKGTIYLSAEAYSKWIEHYPYENWISSKTYRFDVGGDDTSKTISRAVIVRESHAPCSDLSRAVIRSEKNENGKAEKVLYVMLGKAWSDLSTLRKIDGYVDVQ